MTTEKSNLRTCPEGHRYSKSSDCPTCPVCEEKRKPTRHFTAILSAPARRAFEHHRINTLEELSRYTEAEIRQFHGVGPSSIPKLRQALAEQGLSFRKP